MKKLALILMLFPLLLFSCDSLLDVLEEADELTKEQVIEGLKTALIVGSDTSVVVVSQQDGYFEDILIKIFLPQDAQEILDKAINSTLIQNSGLDKFLSAQIEKVILLMNRAAENAAYEAKPIFSDAITNLSLVDAWDILNGINPGASTKSNEFDSSAATHYLMVVTYTQLFEAYEPKINNALAKNLVGDVSTNEAWKVVTDYYNPVAPLIGGEPLNVSLAEHVTQKALDGLFVKVADFEIQIRRDPVAWALKTAESILEIVFGSTQNTSGK
jgi:hypothetical protein